MSSLIDSGIDVNSPLPLPVPESFASRFRNTRLAYYVLTEPGLTPVMLASAMGYADIVRILKEKGARLHAVTQRNKTFALWLAGTFGHVEVMQVLLGAEPGTEASRLRIQIKLADQMATLWKDGAVERTMKISSGRKKFPTPTGRFVVTNKYKDWKSTIYPAKMPFFLRLSCMDFGLHAGYVPGYPASHGCIRVPPSDAKFLFATVPVGTLVEIQ